MPYQKLKHWTLGIITALAVGCSDADVAGVSAPDGAPLPTRASVLSSSWETKAPRLTASAAGFAAQIGTQIYSVGGAHAHLGEPSTLQVYDPATDSWTHRSAPAATHAWTATEFGGLIYIFGGWDGGTVHTTTQVYNPATDTWGAGSHMPRAHNGGAAAAINGRIYVAAGGNSSGYVSITDVYDPVTGQWTQAAPIPQPRAFVGGAAIGGILYVVGGDDGTQRLATLNAYHPATDTWTTKSPMPTARAGAAAVVFDGKLYVLGGSTNAAYTNPDYAASLTTVIEVYDPVTDAWSTGTPMLTPRQSLHATVGNGVLYAIAGYGANGSVSVNEVFKPTIEPEPPQNPTSKQACFKGGWQAFGFANQGQCVRFVETGKDSRT